MRTATRLAATALVLALSLPGTAFADKTPDLTADLVKRLAARDDIEEKNREHFVALMARYPDFLETETAYAAARETFLNLFSGMQKKWAESLLEEYAEISPRMLRDMANDDKYGRDERKKFLAQRAELTRYMTLAAKTSFTDPAFLILLKPVLYHSVRHSSEQDALGKTLAEYAAHMADPYKEKEGYLVRRVNGKYQAVIFFPGQKVVTADGSDRNAAFVLRANDGSFSLSPVIAPSREDYYPGERYALRPREYANGPGGVSINECTMETVLTVTSETGPFAFRADARQTFAPKGLSYTCEPKCSGITYAWNDTTQSFLMSEAICREDDGWKPKSPFAENGTLIPVKTYIEELAKTNEAVRDHKQALETAFATYLDLFEGKALKMARSFVDGWKTDKQYALYRLIGKPDEFAAAYSNNDEAILSYIATAASLVKSPDARLSLLLADMGPRVSAMEKRAKKEQKSRRSPSAHELLRGTETASWFAGYAAARLALLAAPEQKDSGRYNEYAYTASGLEGGETVAFTYKDRYHSSAETKTYDSTFTMKLGTDNAFWGHASVAVGNEPEDERLSPVRRYAAPLQSVIRVLNGKVSFPLPPLPVEKDFFTNPKLDRWGQVLWEIPGKPASSSVCEMASAFSVDTSVAPFALRAKDSMKYASSYICVPECEIPFTWNGSEYVKGAPECLPAGQWGVTRN